MVTKIPRFNFEKFPQADSTLTSQMKSVGEVMAIGSNFAESLQKAIRGMENGKTGFDNIEEELTKTTLRSKLISPSPERLWFIGEAFRQGSSLDEVHDLTKIDNGFFKPLKKLFPQRKR